MAFSAEFGISPPKHLILQSSQDMGDVARSKVIKSNNLKIISILHLTDESVNHTLLQELRNAD